MNQHESAFKALERIGVVAVLQAGKTYAKSESGPYMDLNLDVLSVRKYQTGELVATEYIIALSHYGVQNFDSMADPDMMVRVTTYNDKTLPGLAQVLTYQNDFVHVYQQVYASSPEGEENERPNLVLQAQLSKFLIQWMRTARQQGHKFNAGA